MTSPLSRRDFLKLTGLFSGALALPSARLGLGPWPPDAALEAEMVGRVATSSIYVYSQPRLKGKRIGEIRRDTLLPLAEELISPFGPDYNPRWYRLSEGYVHSGRIQRVEKAHLSSPVTSVPEGGLLGEITVPFTQSQHLTHQGEWIPLYRLYYQSTHWITDLLEGPDGETWCRLSSERMPLRYCIPAGHIRPVLAEELAPVSPQVPLSEKRIVISKEAQTLTAYERGRVVLHTQVSTGTRYNETPVGDYFVMRKFPSRHMGNGIMTSNPDAYELVGVPWVSFFRSAGIALHGTYWHDNFGTKMSHGCVNMRNEEAKWLFRWTTPVFSLPAASRDWQIAGEGTTVVVTGD